jgi:hypothetical protein
MTRRNRGRPYFTMETSKFMTCNFEEIWCFPKIGARLTVRHRMTVTEKMLVLRNWSIILLMFQILVAVFKLCFGIVRKSRLPILFNVILMLSCLIGILGSTYFSVVGMLLYLMGAAGMIISVSVAAGVTIGLKQNEQGAYLWGLYGPFIVDLLLWLWQAYFIFPVTLWYLRIERENELEEEKEKEKAKQAAAQANQGINNVPANSINIPSNTNNRLALAQTGIQINLQPTQKYEAKEEDILVSKNKDNKPDQIEPEDKCCIICTFKNKEGAFYPCGHVCACVTCGGKFKNSFCPICRKLVVDFVKLYEV